MTLNTTTTDRTPDSAASDDVADVFGDFGNALGAIKCALNLTSSTRHAAARERAYLEAISAAEEHVEPARFLRATGALLRIVVPASVSPTEDSEDADQALISEFVTWASNRVSALITACADSDDPRWLSAVAVEFNPAQSDQPRRVVAACVEAAALFCPCPSPGEGNTSVS